MLRLAPSDNVATALRPLEVGEVVDLDGHAVAVNEPVPLCHKLALTDLDAGAEVVKYGQSIGLTKASISAGSHVHVHNMRSARARQSLPE